MVQRWFNYLVALVAPIFAYMQSDGIMHALVCASLTGVIKWIVPWYVAIILVFALGLIRELSQRQHRLNWHDVICNVIGIIIGII